MATANDTTHAPTTQTPVHAVTHFVQWDQPGRRLARSLCGRVVDRDRDHDNEPTCPECTEKLVNINSMSF